MLHFLRALMFNRVIYLGFEYSESSDPSDYVSSQVAEMQVYKDPSEYLTGSRLYPYPSDTAIRNELFTSLQSYIKYLTPSQCRIKAVSRDFKGKTSLIQPYYGTEYSNRTLPEESKYWSRSRSDPGKITIAVAKPLTLTLPPPNQLIPERFELLGAPIPATADEEERTLILNAHPTIIRDDKTYTVWHKLDRSFSQPKAYFVTSLAIPRDKYDPSFVIASRLFASSFLDSLNEYLYDARLAGLSFQFDLATRGVQLTFTGYNDKLPLFVKTVIAALKTYEADEATFNRYKDTLRREYASWKTQQPYYHSSYFANLISETYQFDVEVLQAALERTTASQLKGLMSRLIDESFGTALVIGKVYIIVYMIHNGVYNIQYNIQYYI